VGSGSGSSRIEVRSTLHRTIFAILLLLFCEQISFAEDLRPSNGCTVSDQPDVRPQEKSSAPSTKITDSARLISTCLTALSNHPGEPQLEYQLGRAYQGAADNQNARTWLDRAADHGYGPAQFSMGLIYSEGSTGTEDQAKAFELFRKAAEQGVVAAQSRMGLCYANGLGVAKNYVEAESWLRKAAEQGDVEAQSNLGDVFSHREDTKPNYPEAMRWYRKASVASCTAPGSV
jgi:TPR repeat protein